MTESTDTCDRDIDHCFLHEVPVLEPFHRKEQPKHLEPIKTVILLLILLVHIKIHILRVFIVGVTIVC